MIAVRETELDGGLYEQRYAVDLLNHQLHFIRRPVAVEPPDDTVCYVDNGPRLGEFSRQAVGHYKGGKWRRVKFEPTHWTVLSTSADA